MIEEIQAAGLSRRGLMLAICGGATLASLPRATAEANEAATDEAVKLIAQLTGKTPTPSDRLRLTMPKTFPNGYTVPLAFDIDCPMTDAAHVRYVRVLAPRNPLIDVATFHFTPNRSRPNVSTRIRLAEPQFVVAFAEMNDGALLLAKTWVDVASDGCK